jgi:hypothetical protein
MKIKHSVCSTEEESSALSKLIELAALATYPTVDNQTEALTLAKATFKEELDKLLSKAFKIGKKIGKAKADEKDIEMYQG